MSAIRVGLGVLLVAAALRAAVRASPRPRSQIAPLEIDHPLPSLRLALGRLGYRTRKVSIEQELPVFLEAIARGLRSGVSAEVAIDGARAVLVGPLRAEAEAIARALEFGAPLEQALRGWIVSDPGSGTALSAAALTLGAATGGSRARAVDSVAATLRERLALEAEVMSLSTQARASAVVMAATPVLFMGLSSVADAGTVGFLFGTRFGLSCLGLGVALEAAGAVWMVKLTRSAK